jgi:hypothetical protein
VALLTGQYCIAAGDTALSHAVTVSSGGLKPATWGRNWGSRVSGDS